MFQGLRISYWRCDLTRLSLYLCLYSLWTCWSCMHFSSLHWGSIVTSFRRDGRSNYMEGLMLVTLYFVIALACKWYLFVYTLVWYLTLNVVWVSWEFFSYCTHPFIPAFEGLIQCSGLINLLTFNTAPSLLFRCPALPDLPLCFAPFRVPCIQQSLAAHSSVHLPSAFQKDKYDTLRDLLVETLVSSELKCVDDGLSAYPVCHLVPREAVRIGEKALACQHMMGV